MKRQLPRARLKQSTSPPPRPHQHTSNASHSIPTPLTQDGVSHDPRASRSPSDARSVQLALPMHLPRTPDRTMQDDGRSTGRANRLAQRSLINAKNKVPEQQRVYQAAYNAHTRLWRIVSCSWDARGKTLRREEKEMGEMRAMARGWKRRRRRRKQTTLADEILPRPTEPSQPLPSDALHHRPLGNRCRYD